MVAPVTSYVQKQSDETKNSDDTFADDAELVLSTVAGTYYLVRAVVVWYAAATPDIKVRLRCGGSGFTFLGSIHPDQGGLSLSDPYIAGMQGMTEADINATSYALGGNATTTLRNAVQITGLLYSGASDADIAIEWAQNTSDAGDATVFAGSWLSLEEIVPS